MTVKSPYGLTFGAQGNLQPVPDRIATMTKMGIGNMRLFCNWDSIETSAGVYDFTLLDGVIRLANQAGIAVTYCLDSAPLWHQDNTLCSGKAFMKPQDAASFLAMVAHRYTVGDPTNPGGLFIVGVEGANEGYSDGAAHCQVGPYAAQLMKAVYPAVKAVNPQLVVGSPAIIGLQLSYITNWMEAYYTSGGGPYSDYDHFHFYTQLSPTDTPEPGHASFAMYYQAMAAVQAKYGYASKPLRCSEIGYAVPGKSGTFTYPQQSDYYIAALEVARQSQGKVEMVELFTIGGSDGFSPVEHLGTNEVEHELVAAHSSYVKQYPTWDTQESGGNNVNLNSNGEVADFLDVNQFIPGKSAYECCAYAAALIKYCGAPSHGPAGTTLQASNDAQYFYGKEEGSNLASNTNGMSLQAEEDMLTGMGLHYQPLAVSVQAVKDALAHGLPVMLCGAETGMADMGLGDVVPYSWTPTGNHCIVVSGVASDGNLLVHDTANIGSSGVRPGPRKYEASKLQLVSATAVTPPWQGGNMVPNGWHDDGTTLTAPNGHRVVHGFRDYILTHSWDASNIPLQEEGGLNPLEGSNPPLGAGTRQLFNETMLEWTAKNGVFVGYVGRELLWREGVYGQIYAAYQQQKQQLATLQAQLAQAQQAPQAVSAVQQIKQIVSTF